MALGLGAVLVVNAEAAPEPTTAGLFRAPLPAEWAAGGPNSRDATSTTAQCLPKSLSRVGWQ